MKPKSISLRQHNKEIAHLNDKIAVLRADLGQAVFESGKNLEALRRSVHLTEEEHVNLSDTRTELMYLKMRVDKIERRIKAFLDKDQTELAKVMGVDVIEYGFGYLKLLHDNRHIIHAARTMTH